MKNLTWKNVKQMYVNVRHVQIQQLDKRTMSSKNVGT